MCSSRGSTHASGSGEPMSTPIATVRETEHHDRLFVAGQWTLMWLKFRKHKLAMIGGIITITIYLIAAFAEFVAPFTPDAYRAAYTYAPPQTLHFFKSDAEGFRISPHVNGYKVEIDANAGRRNFVVDPTVELPVGFFVEGEPYKLFGLFPANLHLIAPLDAR